MKKKFDIEVDCAVCAGKIEEAVKQIPGVEDAGVNFITQKMFVVAADDKFDEIMKEVVKVAKKTEPDFEIEL